MRRREGTALRWDLVAAGALTLAGVILLVTIVTGPARLGAVITGLARIPGDAALPADEAAVFWRLLVGTLLGSVALGFVIARGAAKQPRDVECTLAVVAVLVCPALAVGTLEGQQAGLVIGALLGVGLARLGARVSRGPASDRRAGFQPRTPIRSDAGPRDSSPLCSVVAPCHAGASPRLEATRPRT